MTDKDTQSSDVNIISQTQQSLTSITPDTKKENSIEYYNEIDFENDMKVEKTKTKKNMTVVIVECGIARDDEIVKLYKPYGDSVLLIDHNRSDSIKTQIKEMTDLVEKKTPIMCVVLGDGHPDILADIVELLTITERTIWYITQDNTKAIIKYMDKEMKSNPGNLIIFDDSMRAIKIYNQ